MLMRVLYALVRLALPSITSLASLVLARMASKAHKGVAEYQTAIDEIWRRPGSVLIALLLHALAWAFGTLEVLLTFYFLEDRSCSNRR